MKTEKLLDILNEIAPLSTQESWDNSGIQIMMKSSIRKILITLEITEAVIEEAKSEGADMIISHHPLIMSSFDPVKNLAIDDPRGRNIISLISEGISVYSSHTPFDMADGGNNDYMARKLDLYDVNGFETECGMNMIGRTGYFQEPVTPFELAEMISEVLDIEKTKIRITGQDDQLLSKAGICTGAGSDLMIDAFKNGCDVFITGDVKYHDAQNALAMGLCLIDAGHYGTEKTFADNFADILKAATEDEDIEIISSNVNTDPFNIFV